MTLRLLIAIATAPLLSAAAVAQDADTAPREARPKEKKTCRRLMPTGTILPTRVCNTEQRWKAFDANSDEGVGQFRTATRMAGTKRPD